MKFSKAFLISLIPMFFVASACQTSETQCFARKNVADKKQGIGAEKGAVDMFWQAATKMVITDGSQTGKVIEGQELADIIGSLSYDTADVYRAYNGTVGGYLLIDGIRYRFNMATEKDSGYRLLSIYRGTEQVRLVDAAAIPVVK